MANRATRIILFTAALVAPFSVPAQTNGLPRPIYVVSNAYAG